MMEENRAGGVRPTFLIGSKLDENLNMRYLELKGNFG